MEFDMKHLVELVMKYCQPGRIVDIGCGDGKLLQEFYKHNVQIMGVDSKKYASEDFWQKHKGSFVGVDRLSVSISSKIKFDLAISLNAVNRLEKGSEIPFVRNLCSLSDAVLFSASLPGQEDEGCFTAEYQSYWVDVFASCGFVAIDCIRKEIWNNENTAPELKQNCLLYVKREALVNYPCLFSYYIKYGKVELCDVIHPDIYRQIATADKRICDQKKRRILYTIYHAGFFGWVLAHKLAMHPNDDAYLLLGMGPLHSVGRALFEPIFEKCMNEGIFKEIYKYNYFVGRKSIGSIEETEKEIQEEFEKVFLKYGCDLKSFDIIYSGTDMEDPFGIYCSSNGIYFNRFEEAKNNIFAMGEKDIKNHYKQAPGYRDTLLKHKTLYDDNPYQSYVLFPSTDICDLPENKISYFEPSYAVSMMSIEDRMKIYGLFDIKKMALSKDSAWIVLRSHFEIRSLYANYEDYLKKQFPTYKELFVFSIQTLCDYCVPDNIDIIIKPHPHSPVEPKVADRYLKGVASFSAIFNMPLVHCIPKKQLPRYMVVTKTTAVGQNLFDAKNINGQTAWLFPFFMPKLMASIYVLDFMKNLRGNSDKFYLDLGAQFYASKYNLNFLRNDVSSLIKLYFPNSNMHEEDGKKYLVIQQIKDLFDKLSKDNYDFLLYTDAWEEISIHELNSINSKHGMEVIEIDVEPTKSINDIIAPLRKEYMFIIFKNKKDLYDFKDFSYTKDNKVTGTRLNIRRIAFDDYVNVIK